MAEFIYSIFGIAMLGVLVDIIDSGKNTLIDFIYDLIVLVVIITNIVNMLKGFQLL